MYLALERAVIWTYEPATPPVVPPLRLIKSLVAAGAKPAIAPAVSVSMVKIEPVNLSVPFVPIFKLLVAIVVGIKNVKTAP